MRILWASPLPPIRSGVSDYAVELLAEIAHRAQVRVVRPPGWSPDDDWPLADSVELVPTATAPDDDEITLVHLGNNPHHLWLLDRLQQGGRTFVVLHDIVLHHLLVEAAAVDGNAGTLADRLDGAHGTRGRALAKAREHGISGARDPFLLPATRAFLSDGLAGIVVHSRWAQDQIRHAFPDLPSICVGLAAADPGSVQRGPLRAKLGCERDEVVLMHIGFMTPEKGVREILGGLAAAVRSGINASLILVGEGAGFDLIAAAAEQTGVGDRVRATGWVERQDFLTLPAAADLGIVMRTPSAGETSAAAVRFLACGTPVAVVGLHQFLEWPESAAPRVTPGSSAAADVARLLSEVSSAGEKWQERRQAAREAYEERHRPEDVADELLRLLATS